MEKEPAEVRSRLSATGSLSRRRPRQTPPAETLRTAKFHVVGTALAPSRTLSETDISFSISTLSLRIVAIEL